MKHKSVSICCFADGLPERSDDPAFVAVDVIRATTTAVTAVDMGWTCHVAPTLEAALDAASRLPNPLLAGEVGGDMPAGFDITNSPAQLATISDISRPLVLLSSTGSRLMHEIRRNVAYVACFRNYRATIRHLAENHTTVVLVGAGTRDEFREEDQMCCAWIANGLIESGFTPEDRVTLKLITRWRGAPPHGFISSRSVEYLRRSDQLHDLHFILDHFDDVFTACRLKTNSETSMAIAAKV